MKNKKILIIVLIVLILLAVIFGGYKIATSYLFNEDGTISDDHADLIEHLKSVEDVEERKRQIDFSLEHNMITQKEATELY